MISDRSVDSIAHKPLHKPRPSNGARPRKAALYSSGDRRHIRQRWPATIIHIPHTFILVDIIRSLRDLVLRQRLVQQLRFIRHEVQQLQTLASVLDAAMIHKRQLDW